MLKKTNHQPKPGNLAKIKYFLPSGSSNQQQVDKIQSNHLNKIRKQINRKYGGSYSSSKSNTRRHSTSKNQRNQDTLNSHTILNDDVSFQIVGIRDAQQKVISNQKNNFEDKKFRYPLGQRNINQDIFSIESKSARNHNLIETFGTSNQNNSILESSKAVLNISRANQFQKLVKSFPNNNEKLEFEQFLQGLKNDENYQNTISMFTIMYFYEHKKNKK